MALAFRTVQLGTKRVAQEGLRIGAVRYLPRGVPKSGYSRLDLFDVWLPILSPSRDLLHAFKENGLTIAAFFRRYRREMLETNARQVIQTLAELAKQTPLSVGCYCSAASRCHRSVLGELIREAAGAPVHTISQRAVYTIRNASDLRKQEGKSRSTLVERKSWTTAQNWLDAATGLGEKIPILFGDATDCSRLTHWALLDGIDIDNGETAFSFSRLKRFRPVRATHDLRLVSTNEKLSRDYIRPYALVQTPSDLIDAF